MSAHAAFLRGMNLGRRRISNEELAAAFAALGFADVRTFRASGNVAFEITSGAPEDLVARIESGLAQALGYVVPTFLRSAAEVREIADCAPFPQYTLEASEGKLQVALLPRGPSPQAAEAVLAMDDERDRLALGARELYWLPSGPMSDSELDFKAIERLLGATTVRTKGTIEQMAEKFFPV
ncbi:MAG TPA: DUF1697 domain-containing protein [Solirubrobacteraceae bacterium]|nr:DUF1697 domain-containing protein [Solirubrobacteraceae bacterium]